MMKNVISRFLQSQESFIASKEKTLPLVIEPASAEFATPEFLQTFLAEHSSDIQQHIASYGAVLLRGFQVDTTKLFEQTVLSIQGMQGMSHLFMSEPGRERVDGLDYVFHTNNRVKTGGTLHLGGFHTENYYSPDVPSYISFCCLEPAKWGGETGLIHMSQVYAKLDEALKEKLEKKAFFVSKWPIPVIANRYHITPAKVKAVCVEFGLPVEDEKFVVMHKPSVFTHPVTGKKIVQANLCAEIPALNDRVLRHFIRDYRGFRWMMHRMAWKYIGYQRLRQWSLMLPALTRHPINFFKMRKEIRQRMKQYSANSLPRINSVFNEADIKTLASAMRESYASFLWQKGDVLLVDNLQVAHAGMPGKTTKKHPRNIRAMLCNPFKMPYTPSALGLQEKGELLAATLGETMERLSKRAG